MGKTVARLERELSAAEFTEWAAFLAERHRRETEANAQAVETARRGR